MIKAILIDIDDTLLDFEKNAYLALDASFSFQDTKFKEEYFDTFLKINTSLWDKIEKKLITKEELKKVRFVQILNALKIDKDPYKMEEDFRSQLFNFAIPVEGAKETLEYLASKYKVFAASNAMHNQQLARLQKAGMDKYITDLFISEEIGFYKPTKGFFDACFKQMGGIKPSETVIIGDSIGADITGGKEYGLTTIWFNNKNKIRFNDDGVDYEVRNLIDVKNLL